MSERIALRLDEREDVRFNLKITSTDQLGSDPDVQFRFICEAEEVEFAFRGTSLSDGSVQVVVPPMKGVIPEGVYDARMEVVVEGRHFVPLELEAEFKEPMKVVAESVSVVSQKLDESGPVSVVASVKSSTTKKAPRRAKPVKEAPRKRPSVTKMSSQKLADMDKLLKDLG